MKKLIAMLLVLAMVIGWITIPPVHTHAEEATQVEGENSAAVVPLDSTNPEVDREENLTFELNEDGESYRVTFCNRFAHGALTIPATYKGKPVTSIGDSAFEGCTSLTERPKLSVSADNKLVVSYSDPDITNVRAYIYKVDDAEVNDIYDEAALKKIATPTQVWGLSSINKKQLTAQGTYVIHLYYTAQRRLWR